MHSLDPRLFAADPLTPDDVISLNQRRLAGDTKARERMILGTTRLVSKLAGKFGHLGISAEDLFGAGVEGLTRAVDSFDHTRGPYAAWVGINVVTAISQVIANQRYCVSLSRKNARDLKLLRRAIAAGGEDVGTLAKDAGVSEKQSLALLRLRAEPVRLDSEPSSADDGLSFHDLIEDSSHPDPAEILEQNELTALVVEKADELPARERDVIFLYFGLEGPPVPVAKIAATLGISTRWVNHILSSALTLLRSRVAIETGAC